MTILDKYKKAKKKELLKLLKEKEKNEKKIKKEMAKRADIKYTTKYLKENKKLLTENAMTIDKTEYEQIILEMKKRFPEK